MVIDARTKLRMRAKNVMLTNKHVIIIKKQ